MRKENLMIGCSMLLIIILLMACSPLKKPETGETPSAMRDETNAVVGNKYKRGHNIPGKLYWAGSAQDKKVALTFDDGPEDYWTPKILEILKEKNVKGTFFVIGKQAEKYPELLRKIVAEGHVIGNHTFNHRNLLKLDKQEVMTEIEDSATTIHRIIGKTPKLVRPPFGFHNKNVDAVISERKEIIILWSIDTEDWKGLDVKEVKDRVLPKMKKGYIVLQHDGVNPRLGGSVEALSDIIDGLKEQGYTFATIPELLEVPAYQED
jgi:peptidoglycan/xylan/chitin deacetylase (PgdA/CDA1 family)